MKRIAIILSFLLTLACATTVPVTMVLTPTATEVPTQSCTLTPTGDRIGIVIVDTLTVRTGAGESYPAWRVNGVDLYLHKNTVVMGKCIPFENGDAWLGYDADSDGNATKFIAVKVDGKIFVDGVCQ